MRIQSLLLMTNYQIALAVVTVIAALLGTACIVLVFRKPKSEKGAPAENKSETPVQEESKTPAPDSSSQPVSPKPASEVSVPQEPEKEPNEEPVKEPAPVTEVPVSETPAPVQADGDDDDEEDGEPVGKIVYRGEKRLVSVRYDKSYTARLIQTTDKNKEYYSLIKNELLRYGKMKSRISWRQESFRRGRDMLAKIELRGKTLCLYLALSPNDYVESKYLVEDASDAKKNEFTPCLYRIRNDRRARYALELIADMMKNTDAKYKETESVDYAKEYPYEETSVLVEKELVKIVESRTGADYYYAEEDTERETVKQIGAEEADREMSDAEALRLIRESGNVSFPDCQTVVNVDTLNEYFEEGETVTLEDMKERIPFLNRRATYVKVLARGVINKSLVVEADDFAPCAVKMLVLAGGTVYRKRTDRV